MCKEFFLNNSNISYHKVKAEHFKKWLLFKKILLLSNYSCMPFLPIPTPAEPTSLLHLHLPPWFCPCVLYSSSCNPLSSLSPPHSPLPIVRLFLTSMPLVIFCFLFSEVLRLHFPVLEPWVARSDSLPSCSSEFIRMQMWDRPFC